MRVYACNTKVGNEDKTLQLVKTDKKARAWLHDRVEKIMQLEILYAKYLLSLHSKRPYLNKDHTVRRNRHADNYFDFLKENKLIEGETRSSPYYNVWEVK